MDLISPAEILERLCECGEVIIFNVVSRVERSCFVQSFYDMRDYGPRSLIPVSCRVNQISKETY